MLGRILKDLFASQVRLRLGQTDFEAGVEAYKAGKLAAAAEHFTATLRAEPEHLQAHSYAGGIDLRTGRFREALGHFERARALDPQNAECHFGAAVAHRELGATEAARECCETALALDPGLHPAHVEELFEAGEGNLALTGAARGLGGAAAKAEDALSAGEE